MRIGESRRTVVIDGREWPIVACNIKNVDVDIAFGESLEEAQNREPVKSVKIHLRMALISMENGWSIGLDWGSMAECCSIEYKGDIVDDEQPECFEVVILDRNKDLVKSKDGEPASFPHMVEEALASLLVEVSTMPTNAMLSIDRHPDGDIDGKDAWVLNVGIPAGMPIPNRVELPGSGEWHHVAGTD